jgi:hypothetical protein
VPDDAEHRALLDVEADAVEGPEVRVVGLLALLDGFLQEVGLVPGQPELLGDVTDGDGVVGRLQSTSLSSWE